jgi:glycerophosphoryl diester phosphodiesterase
MAWSRYARRVRRIGHRGARGHAPDNTIESFQKALDLGCDEVETDVWSLDGRLVIAHDRPASTADLLSLDDVLDFCKGRMTVNVEMKCAETDALARATGEAVARRVAARRDDDVYVSSFWWPALEAAARVAPSVRRAYIFSSSPERTSLVAAAKAIGLWALHPNKTYATPELIGAAHDAGIAVQPWTVNDPAEIAHLAALGVDGICSDYPERVPREPTP